MKKNKWIITIFIMTFALSIMFSFITNIVTANVSSLFVMTLLLIFVISIGILFDMIGTAALTGNEATFHSMNSSKVKGAKEALSLIKRNNKVATICNDVVGDICGIISGGVGAIIAIGVTAKTGINNVIVSIFISAIISALTVGGKAVFKQYATNNADKIIHRIGIIHNKIFK